MKITKDTIKESITGSSIEQFIVTEKGTNELRRITIDDFTQALSTALSVPEAVNYKIYIATLTQSGTSAPVATVLENTLGGTLVWSYDIVGNYSATLTGAFPDASKVVIKPIIGSTSLSSGSREYYMAGRNDADSIYLGTAYVNNTSGALTASNGVMYDVTPIEIRVYD